MMPFMSILATYLAGAALEYVAKMDINGIIWDPHKMVQSLQKRFMFFIFEQPFLLKDMTIGRYQFAKWNNFTALEYEL